MGKCPLICLLVPLLKNLLPWVRCQDQWILMFLLNSLSSPVEGVTQDGDSSGRGQPLNWKHLPQEIWLGISVSKPRSILSESNLGRDSGNSWKACIHVALHSTAVFWRSAIVRLDLITLTLTDLLGGWVTHLANSLGYWYQSKTRGFKRLILKIFIFFPLKIIWILLSIKIETHEKLMA